MNTKLCTQCELIKPFKDFGNLSKNGCAKNTICKSCIKKYHHQWYIRNKQKIKEKAAIYYQTHKSYRAEIHKEWVSNNRRLKQYLDRKSLLKYCTPSGTDMRAIKYIYLNRPDGMVIDHIIPLKGEGVCGLHVPYNLQYLTPDDNNIKYNKY